MSPSIDHREALSIGGAELDPSNLGLAHLGCNISKGDGTGANPVKTSRSW